MKELAPAIENLLRYHATTPRALRDAVVAQCNRQYARSLLARALCGASILRCDDPYGLAAEIAPVEHDEATAILAEVDSRTLYPAVPSMEKV